MRTTRATGPLHGAAAAWLLLAMCLPACAAKQRIALDCIPKQVTVYVDRRAIEPGTREIELRTDEPHQVYLKAPGHEPRLVVLEPQTDANGRSVLHPPDVCVELVRIGVDRELSVEVEKPDAGPAPASEGQTP